MYRIGLSRAYRDGYSWRHGFDFHIGNWLCSVSFHGNGVFGNGSRWFSGWTNWGKEVALEEKEFGYDTGGEVIEDADGRANLGAIFTEEDNAHYRDIGF